MIIGIDGNEANSDNRVGVHQYTFELLHALHKLNNNHKFVIYLSRKPKKDLPKKNARWEYKVLSTKKLWILTRLTPHLLFREKPTVFFCPTHYLPPIPSLPKVCVIHDLRYLENSGQFKKYDFWQLRYWTAISLSISKYIISVSKSTKKDISRNYSNALSKVKVVHHGYAADKFNTKITDKKIAKVKKDYKIKGDYLIFLSTLKPSKNIEGLLDAYKQFSELKSKTSDNIPKLVIAGKKGWLYKSIFEKVNQLRIENSVIFTDYLPEKAKPALLAGAKLYILPSFTEGFGMGVLEAMACGTPCVISKVDSLPETGGKAAIYVDPSDNKSIACGIQKVLEMDTKEYNRLIAISITQAKKFSWEKTAKETLSILEKAGENNHVQR